jgi:hypothetical protein
MLRDLDLSVAAFLGGLLPAGTAIRFDPPAASWDGDGTPPDAPLLDAFLYDVRETQPPAGDGTLARGDDGQATGWQPPVRRYQVSYLLTAWPRANGHGDGEHELLGAVLTGCATTLALPPPCLRGVLAEATEPVPLACAAAARAADTTQLWPVLGVRARTALDLMVVAPVVPALLTGLSPGVRNVDVGVRPRTPAPRAGSAPARPRQRITEG